MYCPMCAGKTAVQQTWHTDDESYRRRKCDECSFVFQSVEMVDLTSYQRYLDKYAKRA